MQGEKGQLRRWDERVIRITREALFAQGRAIFEQKLMEQRANSQGRKVQRFAVHKRVLELRNGIDFKEREKRAMRRNAAAERSARALAEIMKQKKANRAESDRCHDANAIATFSKLQECTLASAVR
ncbi:hypothetical protein PMAYCL1PPCAC_26621 [Pristionchus mayeri]|uniref:Uncharacterized protein n=1 Tax=Pristionchus mayeri TaxID=1317129 RepID=A0AAN5D4V8_9BILA|nr:hypothetical protein PMAYCL1PPCAC_26621 [Pristionchus mayeri]